MISSSKVELVTILTLVFLTVSLASAEGKKGYGDNCTLDENYKDPCEEDKYKYFRCYSGKCGCGSLLYEEDPVSGTWSCVEKAPNGACPSKENRGYRMKCTANAICSGFMDWGLSRCSCKEGYYVTTEGRCSKDRKDLDPNHIQYYDAEPVEPEATSVELGSTLAPTVPIDLNNDTGKRNMEANAPSGGTVLLTPLFNLVLCLFFLW